MTTDLRSTAIAILRDNDRGQYTVPTKGLYPFQWNWDSCFTALGQSHFDLDRAWTEVETLFAHQWDDGMVPHMVFHEEALGYFPGPEVWGTGRATPTSGITQLPIAGFAIHELWKRSGPLYGTNDARHTGAPHTLNRDGFVRDFRAMLGALLDAGVPAQNICIGSPAYISDAGFAVGDPEFTGQSRPNFDAYVTSVRHLAGEFGTFYAPVNETMLSRGGDALVLADCIHPNAAGHAIIADAFAAAALIE